MRRYRMSDLCEESGLSRSAIHRYIRMGLVSKHEGGQTNAAYYTDLHRNQLNQVARFKERNRTLRDMAEEVAGGPRHD